MGRGSNSFEKAIEAESESMAEEKVYSLLGSDHAISRKKIKIENIKKG